MTYLYSSHSAMMFTAAVSCLKSLSSGSMERHGNLFCLTNIVEQLLICESQC